MNRTVAPSYSQAQDLKLVLPEKIMLNHGVALYWLKDVPDASVKLEISWDAGSKYQDKHLVASFTSKMLLSGSENLSAKAISEEIDFYGGYAQQEMDKDHAGISLYGLAENIEAIFEVFEKAFALVSFPDSELQKELDISLNKFRVESQKVKTLCRRAFVKGLYGENTKYGQVASEEDFKKLQSADLLNYFNDKYKFAPVIFLTGNVPDQFIDKLRLWTNHFKPIEQPHFSQDFSQTKGRVEIPKEGALQSAIRIGRLMFKKDHPDYYKFQLLNTILGGYFGSRLMTNIREEKGYTYGIGSGMAVLQDVGYFFVSTEVGSSVKEDAIKEVFHEFDRLKNELISADELVKVKNYMLGEFLRQADGPLHMMEIFKNIYFNRLPPTYYSDFIKAIHSATAEELMTLANKYLVRDAMVEVTAG
ncbi:MAG: insulinase family protein [Crocinitomicaceae bacterium]|nr:insulinase family protein [Crocinitomicaceae bacterium]